MEIFNNHKTRYNIDKYKTHNNKANNYRNKFTNLTVDKYNSSYKSKACKGGLTGMGTVVVCIMLELLLHHCCREIVSG